MAGNRVGTRKDDPRPILVKSYGSRKYTTQPGGREGMQRLWLKFVACNECVATSLRNQNVPDRYPKTQRHRSLPPCKYLPLPKPARLYNGTPAPVSASPPRSVNRSSSPGMTLDLHPSASTQHKQPTSKLKPRAQSPPPDKAGAMSRACPSRCLSRRPRVGCHVTRACDCHRGT